MRNRALGRRVRGVVRFDISRLFRTFTAFPTINLKGGWLRLRRNKALIATYGLFSFHEYGGLRMRKWERLA